MTTAPVPTPATPPPNTSSTVAPSLVAPSPVAPLTAGPSPASRSFDTPGRLTRTPETWLAYLAICIYVFVLCGIGPSIPFLEDDLRLNHSQAVLHWTVFSAGATAAGLYAHRLSARFGRRGVIWLGLVGSTTGGVLMAMGSTLAVTLTGVALAGLTGGVSGIIVNAVLADSHEGAARDATMLEAHVLGGTSAMLAPLALGAFALSPVGWHGASLIPVVALGALWLRFRPVRIPPQPVAPQSRAANGRWPAGFVLAIMLAVVLSTIETSVALWGATFLRSVGVRKELASASVAIFYGCEVVGRLVLGRLAMRPRFAGRLLFMGMAGGCLGFLLFWAGGPVPIRLAGFAIAGLMISAFYPLSASQVMARMGGRTDSGSARHSVFMGAGAIAVPSVLAFVADRAGIFRAMGIVPILFAVAFAVYAVLHRRDRSVRESVDDTLALDREGAP